jgi:hypothetical protein
MATGTRSSNATSRNAASNSDGPITSTPPTSKIAKAAPTAPRLSTPRPSHLALLHASGRRAREKIAVEASRQEPATITPGTPSVDRISGSAVVYASATPTPARSSTADTSQTFARIDCVDMLGRSSSRRSVRDSITRGG